VTAAPLELDACEDVPPSNHGYGMATIDLFLRLVKEGVSLRCVPRVLKVICEAFGWSMDIPHWTSGRLWLMRLGHAMLTMPLVQADDWAWLVDHSVQIGTSKCLAVVGIRLQDMPKVGESLQHHDLQLIALLPSASWTGPDVDTALEEAVKRTGVPRVIVTDHGSDLLSGIRLFQDRHVETAEIYDVKHKAACLLKHRLQNAASWQEFQRQLGQTRSAVQQTELGFLTPPATKTKARYMNLESQLAWAEHVLEVMANPPKQVLEWTTAARLQEKLSWLTDFEESVAEWSEWQQVVNLAVSFVNRQGVYRGMAKELRASLPRPLAHDSSRSLAKELIDFLKKQARQAKGTERLPGSTEVLESCFGKLKQLEKQQARGGFTGLLLSFGAILAQSTTQIVKGALQHSSCKAVYQWCAKNLGTTLFAQRKIAFAGATKAG